MEVVKVVLTLDRMARDPGLGVRGGTIRRNRP